MATQFRQVRSLADDVHFVIDRRLRQRCEQILNALPLQHAGDDEDFGLRPVRGVLADLEAIRDHHRLAGIGALRVDQLLEHGARRDDPGAVVDDLVPERDSGDDARLSSDGD